jgi:hypothetical protein
LTCTPQTGSSLSLCCGGGNCGNPNPPIGATCGTVQNGATCTPGITFPAATGGNDSCGYSAKQFNESTVLCSITAVGGGSKPATISAFYNDEHALTLGCETATYPVSTLSSVPGQQTYPQLGDPACVDNYGRPLRPVLYVTDLTGDASCNKGDLQQGGTPYDPVAIFGTWKYATETTGSEVGTPLKADPAQNNWNLGASPPADPVTSAIQACTLNTSTTGGGKEQYSAEIQFEVGLISGHSYRLQVIVHDGDQNKGGDSGEGCAIYCAGTGSPVCPTGVAACNADGQCASGYACGTDGCCQPVGCPAGISACTSDDQCTSGTCADGCCQPVTCPLGASQCTADGQCPAGYTCGDGCCWSNLCPLGTAACTADGQCDPGYSCGDGCCWPSASASSSSSSSSSGGGLTDAQSDAVQGY